MYVHVLEESAEVRSTGASPRCQEDAWLHAPAIQVQESAKNPSRHGLNIIARVPLQTTSRERSGRCKCTNDVHMPRKTGEEQLLLLTAPTLRQRNCESNSAVPGWTGTHCVLSYTRKGSSLENAGSVKLINVLKLDVAQMSPPVVDGSQSRAAHLPPNAPMAAPRQDAMPHIRFRLVARQHGEQPQTGTHHTKRVWMRHGTDHTANDVATCSKPSKTQERCLHERQRGSRAILCGGKPVTHIEREHVGNDVRRRERAATGTIIAFFLSKKNMFRSCFLLTVHTTSACCWELKSPRLIPTVWAERDALLFAPIPQGHGLRP